MDSSDETEHYELVRFYIGNKIVSKVKLDEERLDILRNRPYYLYHDLIDREERNMLMHEGFRQERVNYLERMRFKQEIPDLNTFIGGYNCLFIREQRILAGNVSSRKSDDDEDESEKYTITQLAQQIRRMYAVEILYHRFFDQNKVIHVSREGGHTCRSVVESYKALKQVEPLRKAIVIKDADFARLDGEDLTTDPDIFYADGHDHEMMCAKLNAVRKAVFSNIDPDIDIEAFYDELFNDIRTLSFFKWYNFRTKSGYSFKKQPSMTESVTNLQSLAWIEDRSYRVTLRGLKENNPNPDEVTLAHIDPTEVVALMVQYQDADRYELTNGHDFLSRLNHKLNKKYNLKRSEDVYREIFYTVMTYEFQKTKLYDDLRQWCVTNSIDIFLKATA